MKTCTGCTVSKLESEYYSYPSGKPYSKCKTCHSARMRTWHRENSDTRRKSNWLHKYGIEFTPEQYQEMHDLQAGLCKICGRAEPASGRRLAVDHDHKTGRVRGLLCTKCNTTVGWVEMYPDLIAYLAKET
jgi:hypothetical protein